MKFKLNEIMNNEVCIYSLIITQVIFGNYMKLN